MSTPDIAAVARRLRAGADAITAFVSDVEAEEARWKPSPKSWSILDILGHLVDEERLDFRTRLDFILHRPGEPFPPIDPEGWVREKNFNARVLHELTQEFLAERDGSITWLRGISSPDWSLHYDHPTAGRLTAADMLYAWAAHDVLHVRQLARVRYARLAAVAAPRSLNYAGTW
jgi:DinB superfamily